MTARFAKLLGPIVAAFVVLAATAAVALATTPAAGYEQFAGCPSKSENSEITSCFNSTITGGTFQMGNKTVPITNPIGLSGGFNEAGYGFAANSKGGMTPVKQEVPGGIVGLTGLTELTELLGIEALKLYAVTELAGQPAHPLEIPFYVPIKVHLINAVLGNNCYVGSNAHPIELNLTYETTSPPPPNEPITGVQPIFRQDRKTHILHLEKGTFVDNSFAAPGASGCALHLGFIPIPINGLIDLASGLPAAAGTNTTEQEVDAEFVASKFVYP